MGMLNERLNKAFRRSRGGKISYDGNDERGERLKWRIGLFVS